MEQLLLAMGLIASFAVLMVAVVAYQKSLQSPQPKSVLDADQVDDRDTLAAGDDEPDNI